jgi:hypothetical protein
VHLFRHLLQPAGLFLLLPVNRLLHL